MKIWNAVIAGAVVGFMVSFAPGCTPTQVEVKCTVDSCKGCCDSKLGCVEGTKVEACGLGAVACQKCDTGQSCDKGICRLGTSSTPDASTPVKPQCGPTTCNGCCDATGTCVAGNLLANCGVAGRVCSACTAGQSCLSGACVTPQTCTGCTDALGACQAGNTDSACGAAGGVCVVCQPGQTCTNGQCLGGAACSASNCADGCCSGDTCVRGQPSSIQCGTGGAACVGCTAPEVCQEDGKCGMPSFTNDGGGLNSCGPGSLIECLDGCCADVGGAKVCLPGTTFAACGSGGLACSFCNPLQGKSCVNQACQ